MDSFGELWINLQLKYLWWNVLYVNWLSWPSCAGGVIFFTVCAHKSDRQKIFIAGVHRRSTLWGVLVFCSGHLACSLSSGLSKLIWSKVMKIARIAWISVVIMVLLFLVSNSAQACPNCFASTTKKVLQTYYVSAIFLSLLPFGVLAFISIWIFRYKRHLSGTKSSLADSQSRRQYPPSEISH